MFVKISETEWVNLEQVSCIYLEEEINRGKDKNEFPELYRFAFSGIGGVLLSRPFKTKEEAMKWFNEEIDPALKDHNDAKFAPIDLNHLYDIAKYTERIAITLEELIENQEV